MKTRIALVALLALTVVACGSDDDEATLGTGAVFVQTVEVIERDGEYIAVVTGWYPDACSSFGGSEQRNAGDTVGLTMTSTRDQFAVCAQVLTDMREEIPLDTSDLDPGDYTLLVNREVATEFTVS